MLTTERHCHLGPIYPGMQTLFCLSLNSGCRSFFGVGWSIFGSFQPVVASSTGTRGSGGDRQCMTDHMTKLFGDSVLILVLPFVWLWISILLGCFSFFFQLRIFRHCSHSSFIVQVFRLWLKGWSFWFFNGPSYFYVCQWLPVPQALEGQEVIDNLWQII